MSEKKTIAEIARDARKDFEASYTEAGKYDPNWRDACDAAVANAVLEAAGIATLKASLAEAVEILRPFAQVADQFNDVAHDNDWRIGGRYAGGQDPSDIVLGHLRRARSFLQSHGGKE
jgi:hypothetical protein